MFSPVLILHILLAIAFTVFMQSYFEQLYKTTACQHLSGCELTLSEDEVHASELYGVPACPVKDCNGDNECCSRCKFVYGNVWTHSSVTMKSTKKLQDPTWIIIGVIGANFLAFVIIFGVNIAKKRTINPAYDPYDPECEIPEYESTPAFTSTKARAVIGLTLILMFLSIMGLMGFLIVVILTDFHFYQICHSTLVILGSWVVLCMFLLIDALMKFLPSVTKVMKKNRMIKKAYETVDQGLSAKRLMEAEKINTNITCCSKILNYPLGILLLWWVLVTIYFIGIGEGRWNPIKF